MQNLVPRAIAIIEFGAKGDGCAVAKYKTTKMTEKQSILAVNSIFPALADPTKVDPSRRVTLRQALTWQKAGPPRRVTLPNR